MLLEVIPLGSPPSCTSQKEPSSPPQFGGEGNLPGHSTEKRSYWFFLKIARLLPIPKCRNTFITLPHICKSLEDKSMVIHSKNLFLFPSVYPGTEYTSAPIWKEILLICFESYKCIPCFHLGRVDRGM